MQVKAFDEESEEDLTDCINQFLDENPTIDLFDIKFSVAFGIFEEEQIYCFSALLIFR